LASEVIENLLASDDALESELGQALLKWQDDKASKGLSRSLGYEPREIREKGAVSVISARVMKGSSGFEEVDQNSTYESIVHRHPDRFTDEVVAVARRRLQGGQIEDQKITSEDLRLIATSRSKQRFSELTEAEHSAYVRVSGALQTLGNLVKSTLADPSKFEVRTTSGFNVNSGVRSFIPKDLWFAVSPRKNAEGLAALPQLFMIVSERGVEYGYAASISPSDFSQKAPKNAVRAAAPKVFSALPDPRSAEATGIAEDIEASNRWFYRSKNRLPSNESEFSNLHEWLSYLKSDKGKRKAAGAICSYLEGDQIDHADLSDEIATMARIFEPLIDREWHTSETVVELQDLASERLIAQATADLDGRTEFAELLRRFMEVFRSKREGPFTTDGELGSVMRELREWLQGLPSISSRPDIKVKISVGQGGWTKTPWIALLDSRETTSTQ